MHRVLANRIKEYAPSNVLEQENVLQETMQQYVLASLAREGFFSQAAFHGGTCLRILHGMNRFSEDLDFVLKAPDRRFEWEPYLDRIRSDSEAEGLRLEVGGRSRSDATVKKVFLKTDSIGQILELDLPYERHARVLPTSPWSCTSSGFLSPPAFRHAISSARDGPSS